MNVFKTMILMFLLVGGISIVGYVIVASFMLTHYIMTIGMVVFFSIILTVVFLNLYE